MLNHIHYFARRYDMIRVLLVIDDPDIRQNLKSLIPWDDLGLILASESDNCEDGLHKIYTIKPDIVITDIDNETLSGMQMIDTALRNGFSGKLIIFSDSAEFNNIRKLISWGVTQFLIKPVDELELIYSLKVISNEIVTQREIAYKLQKGDEYINNKRIKALLLGDEKTLTNLDLSSYTYTRYDVALISITSDVDYSDQLNLLDSISKELSLKNDTDVISTDLSGILAVIFKGWTRSHITGYLNKLYKANMRKIFVSLGMSVTGIYMIKQSYLSADAIYKNKFLYLHYGVATAENTILSNVKTNDLDEVAKHIYAYIEINDLPKLEYTLEQFRETLCHNGYTAERIKVTCISLIMGIKARFIKNLGEKKSESIFSEEAINSIDSMSSLYEIIEFLKHTLSELSDLHFGRTTKSTMERVVQYINSNYSQELRLELLANIFGYNSAYLGKVFHQYTGENFNNYLDRIRISEAKRLLSTEEYKVYEVAELVGYSNINYFHNKFKKIVGISPLSFKKNNI